MDNICYTLVYSIGATGGSGTGPASTRPSSLCSSSDGSSTVAACVHASVSSPRYDDTNRVSLEHCGAHQPLLNTATMTSKASSKVCRRLHTSLPASRSPTIYTTTCNNWVTPGPSMGNDSASPSVYGSPLYCTGRSKSSGLSSGQISENIRTIFKKRIVKDSGLDTLCLSSEDLIAFTKSAGQAGLVTRQVMEDLTIMHPSVSYESKCRYLVLHINKKIRHGGEMLNKFINLIFKFFLYRSNKAVCL